MPAADGKTLLCLYYADVMFRLMKIDPTKKPKPYPQNSYLNYIVLASSWDIEAGTTNDWHEVSEYLKKVSPNTFDQEAGRKLDLGIFRSHFGREELLGVVEHQIKNMQSFGATY